MIVSCEKCQAPYQVDETQIGEDGLGLACTACHHQFRVVRKAVFLVEELDAQEAGKTVAATPASSQDIEAEKNQLNPPVSADEPSVFAPKPKKMPITLPRRFYANKPERESSSLRPFLLLLLAIGLGIIFWKQVYPEHYQNALNQIDLHYEKVANQIQPSGLPSPQAKTWYLRGRGESVFDTVEHYKEAVEHYRHALESDGQYAAAYGSLSEAAAELAEIALARSETEEARAWLEESLRASTRAATLDPDCLEAQRGIAAYERLQGRFVQAQAHLDRAMVKNPNDVELYLATGRNYLSRPGLEDMAKEYFTKAVNLDDRSIRAHRYLAVVHHRMHHDHEALKQWQKVLDLHADHKIAQFEVARLQTILENTSNVSAKVKIEKNRVTVDEDPQEPKQE